MRPTFFSSLLAIAFLSAGSATAAEYFHYNVRLLDSAKNPTCRDYGIYTSDASPYNGYYKVATDYQLAALFTTTDQSGFSGQNLTVGTNGNLIAQGEVIDAGALIDCSYPKLYDGQDPCQFVIAGGLRSRAGLMDPKIPFAQQYFYESLGTFTTVDRVIGMSGSGRWRFPIIREYNSTVINNQWGLPYFVTNTASANLVKMYKTLGMTVSYSPWGSYNPNDLKVSLSSTTLSPANSTPVTRDQIGLMLNGDAYNAIKLLYSLYVTPGKKDSLYPRQPEQPCN